MDGFGTPTGGIVHDFNNILHIILAYSSRLLRGKIEPETILWRLRKALSQNGKEAPPQATEDPVDDGIQNQPEFSLRALQRSAEKHFRSLTMIRGVK